jgi:hypothetical protein
LSGGTVGHYNGERTHILIHAANLASQLNGCIAPGVKLGCLNDKWAVLSSRNAMSRLKNSLPDRWQLFIKAVTSGKPNYIPA